MRELAVLAAEHVHLWPLSALGAVDRRQLKAVEVVADRREGIAPGLQERRVLRNPPPA